MTITEVIIPTLLVLIHDANSESSARVILVNPLKWEDNKTTKAFNLKQLDKKT